MDTKRPSYDEWMYWTQVVVDRLTTVTHIYAHPPFSDVFMPDKDRQDKLAAALSILRGLHEMTDTYDMVTPQDSRAAIEREETLMEQLPFAFESVLQHLPEWSSDMQLLLKSGWTGNCAGKLAQILFCGPDGRIGEGIGSGLPENGRLPEVLSSLVDRERSGEGRAPRAPKPPRAPARMRREDLAKLWAKQNSSFLRSAGRVD